MSNIYKLELSDNDYYRFKIIYDNGIHYFNDLTSIKIVNHSHTISLKPNNILYYKYALIIFDNNTACNYSYKLHGALTFNYACSIIIELKDYDNDFINVFEENLKQLTTLIRKDEKISNV